MNKAVALAVAAALMGGCVTPQPVVVQVPEYRVENTRQPVQPVQPKPLTEMTAGERVDVTTGAWIFNCWAGGYSRSGDEDWSYMPEKDAPEMGFVALTYEDILYEDHILCPHKVNIDTDDFTACQRSFVMYEEHSDTEEFVRYRGLDGAVWQTSYSAEMGDDKSINVFWFTETGGLALECSLEEHLED